MELPKYANQRKGVYHLPNINKSQKWSHTWNVFIGKNFQTRVFKLDFNNSAYSLLDVIWWCEKQCKGVVFLHLGDQYNYLGFHKKGDAMIFKLRWTKVVT